MEERNIPLWIILSLLTCGIAGLFWLAAIARDLEHLAPGQGPNVALDIVLLILTCGLYHFWILWHYPDLIVRIQRERGDVVNPQLPLICLLLGILTLMIVPLAVMQGELNKMSFDDVSY